MSRGLRCFQSRISAGLKIGIWVVALILSGRGIAQDKVSIAVGAGFPEITNVGLRLQLRQTQLGISTGYWRSAEDPYTPGTGDEKYFSLAGDLFYHFGGQSDLSEQRPWYLRGQLCYYKQEDNLSLYKYYYLSTRVGRNFNISRKLGIGVDGGLAFQLYRKRIIKEPRAGFNFDFELPVLPGFGVALFYRI